MTFNQSENSNLLYYSAKRLVFIILTAILLNYSAFAQMRGSAESDFTDIEKQRRIQSTTIPQSEKVLLDKKIDPENYILGPGDVLSIFTWGNYEGQYTLTVSPEGMLLIPAVGPVEVSGHTLNDAAEIISSNILSRFRNVEVVVSLANLRHFKVFVGGALKFPGAYPATPATRVSEIIENAGGFLGSEEENDNYRSDFRESILGGKKASKRNVIVVSQNGDSTKADIIFGAVKNPGYFEYSERDSLDDLIELAHGLALNADSQNLEIVRFQPDNKKTFNFDVDLTAESWKIALQPDDRVYVKEIQDYHEKFQVSLLGEFKFPGYYAIVLQEAEMFRISKEEIVDPEYERLKNMEVADMSESEYEYFKIKSRSKPGRISVDFAGLFIDGDKNKDFVLRDGDKIRVPRKSKVVNIIGEVSNPGILPYVQGEDYRYYIGQAGGYSDRARKSGVSVINGITGEWKKADKGKPLEPGDTIWISEKKKRDYWGFIKDTLIFVGNLATVYLVIQQATK
jgi:protein involved in polysaccharide export with SLBB domain